jgi:FixJ family two-component response regulator
MREEAPMVYIVDDDALFRRSIERLVGAAGFQTRGFASADAFLAAERPDVPACLVLDVFMPGLTGLDLQRQLAGQGVEIIFITGHGDVPMTVRAMKAGAVEFLTKPFADHALLEAIRQALERNRRERRRRAELAEIRRRYEALTPRERDVMRLVVRGLLNKQVAADLGISEITVKVHRRNVMRKMHASSLAELVRISERLELLNSLFPDPDAC